MYFIEIVESSLNLVNTSFSNIFLNECYLIWINKTNGIIFMENLIFYNITVISMQINLIKILNSFDDFTMKYSLFMYIQTSN